MADIYLAISETPTVVTLTSAVINSAAASSVTVTNTVTVALDANSLSALENVTVTVGAAITGTVTVSSLPSISGTVTANGLALGQEPLNVFPIGIGQLGGGGVRAVADFVGYYIPVAVREIQSTDLGAQADAVATTDTGTFSVIAFIKRGLQNWTSLLAKIPTLVSGRIPVDGSGVTQPVSLASVPTHGVTGTFWQTTQPISGTVTANTGLTQPLTDTELRATSVPVSLASLPSLTAGSAQIGSVTASISNSVTIASLPAISGTVTANLSISATAITSGVFSSLTSATLVPGNVARKMATVYNLGAGQLFVNAGATATTLGGGFMVALSSGDFYECDYTTTTLSAIFATAGTCSWMSH